MSVASGRRRQTGIGRRRQRRPAEAGRGWQRLAGAGTHLNVDESRSRFFDHFGDEIESGNF
jgi:hypothetical protein